MLLLHATTTEIHQVRGISGSSARIELPCLVDQQNCGEVYYITWTRQSLNGFQNTTSSSSSFSSQQQHLPSSPPSQSSILSNNLNHHQQQWTRVYLYTGSNDSLPHKPIGDLVNRATFLMPDRRQTIASNDNDNNNDNDSSDEDDIQQQQQQQQSTKNSQPMAKLVIEEPRVSDEGLYKCDVTYVKGKCPSISLVRVQMLALPEKAQIISNNNNQQHSSSAASPSGEIIPDGHLVGPYNEHEQLKLTCLVYGGRPQPKSVIWRKIDTSGRTINLMPFKYTSPSQASSVPAVTTTTTTTAQQTRHLSSFQSVVQVDLNHTLTSADLGAKFECHVEHEAIEQQPTARAASSSSNSNHIQLDSGPPSAQSHETLHDSMLDLHPSSRGLQLESNPGSLSDQVGSETSLSGVLLSQAANSRSKSLDSHVFVDLNGECFYPSTWLPNIT